MSVILQFPENETKSSAANEDLTPVQTSADLEADFGLICKKALTVLLSVICALLILEGLARVTITLGHPAQGISDEFDSKCAIAALPVTKIQDNTCLVIGTSLSSAGIYADLLINRFSNAGYDVDVRNLACSGSWPKDQLFILNQAIKAGVRPTLVLCDLTPLALNAEGPFARHYSPAFSESFTGSCNVEDYTVKGILHRFLARSSFLYGYRSYLKDQLNSLFERIFNPEKFLQAHYAKAATSEISPKGWVPGYLVKTDEELRQTLTLPKRLKQLSDIPRKKYSGQIATYDWVAPIKEYCAKKGIPVVFLWLPQHPLAEEFYSKHLHLSQQDCQHSFAHAVEQNGAVWLDMHNCDNDSGHFSDFEHLNVAGAVKAADSLLKAFTEPPLNHLLKKRSCGNQ